MLFFLENYIIAIVSLDLTNSFYKSTNPNFLA